MRAKQHDRALALAVAHADQPKRDAREKAPVGARQALQVRRRPDLLERGTPRSPDRPSAPSAPRPCPESSEVESPRSAITARSRRALVGFRLRTALCRLSRALTGHRDDDVPGCCYPTRVADAASPHRHPARASRSPSSPCDALLARAEELARSWAIALILVRPLAAIGELPLEELARDAPALCAQALRAVQSDVELERLPDGARRARREQCRRGARLRRRCAARTSRRRSSMPSRRCAACCGQALLDQLQRAVRARMLARHGRSARVRVRGACWRLPSSRPPPVAHARGRARMGRRPDCHVRSAAREPSMYRRRRRGGDRRRARARARATAARAFAGVDEPSPSLARTMPRAQRGASGREMSHARP